jgi:hypothetical protein
MKKILGYFSFILLLTSCGDKDNALQPDTIQITCKTLRSENPSRCITNIGVATPANEICLMGFGTGSVAGQVIPSAVKTNVDNGLIKLVNDSNGKKLLLTTVSGSPNYLILQQEGDVGFTSTVTLPACP